MATPPVGVRLELKNNKFEVARDVGSNNVSIGRVDGDVYFPGQQQRHDKRTLANSVSELDFGPNQSLAFEKYTPGTLLWVIEQPEVRTWLDSAEGVLWCSGKPGTGKTILASFIVNHLQQSQRRDPRAVAAVCPIYCRYDTTRTTRQLFAALLRQIILSCSSAVTYRVQEACETGQRLTLNDILAVLQENFDRYPNIYIVIDAFDECFSEQTRHDFLQKLLALTHVKILITSRPLPSIKSSLANIPRFHISAQEADLRAHFEARSCINPTLAKLLPKVAEVDVAGRIVAKAAGMFLLADLHITSISTQTNAAQLLRAVEDLPSEANQTYDETLRRIGQQGENKKKLAFLAISWVFCAMRVLTLRELQYLIAITRLQREPEVAELDEEDSIVSACAGLVQVRAWGRKSEVDSVRNKDHNDVQRYPYKVGDSPKSDVEAATTIWEGKSEVGFVHYTVQEYLNKVGDSAEFLSDVEVALTCMKIISFPTPDRCPVFSYAASIWGVLVHHLEHHQEVLDLALSQLNNSSIIAMLSSVRIEPVLQSYGGEYVGACGAKAIHLIATYGLLRTGKRFIETRNQTSSSSVMDELDDSGCSALIWAARDGRPEMVKLFMDIIPNLDINAPDEKFSETPLVWAVQSGHADVVKTLLQSASVDVNAWGHTGRSPLSWAVQSRCREIVKMLLEAPSMIVDGRRDAWVRTPFSLAAEIGHLAILNDLFVPRLEIEAVDKQWGRTPLSWACGNGHLAVVERLLSVDGVDGNSRDYRLGRTPLLWAAANGHLPVVQSLANAAMVNVNATDKNGRTCLMLAAANGHAQVVDFILRAPHIDINATDRNGQSPLSWASDLGHAKVVKSLLSIQDVDLNSSMVDGRTPLSLAAGNGHRDVVKVLLSHPNVDVNAKDQNGRTPLSFAVEHNEGGVVRLLLASDRVDLEARDNNGRTVLSWAAEKARKELVNLLVDVMDINAADHTGQTPLQWATKNIESFDVAALLISKCDDITGQIVDDTNSTLLLSATRVGHLQLIVQLLAQPNIDSNARDSKYGRTPLCWAALNGHIDALEALLSADGIDVNKPDKFGQTPLCWSAKSGHLSIARLLLDRAEVDSEAADQDGRTPFSWAVINGHVELVKFFMNNGQVNLNTSDGQWGRTPLIWATARAHHEIIILLLHYDSAVDFNARDRYGQTALSFAAEQGRSDLARAILSIPDVDVNAADSVGETPLHHAARKGHIEVVKLLLAHPRIDPNLKETKHGCSPLLLVLLLSARKRPVIEILQLLLIHPAVDVNTRIGTASDQLVSTPLGWAAEQGNVDAVKLLINVPNIDLDSRDSKNRSPIDQAMAGGHLAVVEVLRNAKANVRDKRPEEDEEEEEEISPCFDESIQPTSIPTSGGQHYHLPIVISLLSPLQTRSLQSMLWIGHNSV